MTMAKMMMAMAILAVVLAGCSNAELETAQAELAEVKLELAATQAELADALNLVATQRIDADVQKGRIARLESDAVDAGLIQAEYYHRGVEEGFAATGKTFNILQGCYHDRDFALQNGFCNTLQLSACRYSAALVEAGHPPFWDGANIGNCKTHFNRR